MSTQNAVSCNKRTAEKMSQIHETITVNKNKTNNAELFQSQPHSDGENDFSLNSSDRENKDPNGGMRQMLNTQCLASSETRKITHELNDRLSPAEKSNEIVTPTVNAKTLETAKKRNIPVPKYLKKYNISDKIYSSIFLCKDCCKIFTHLDAGRLHNCVIKRRGRKPKL